MPTIVSHLLMASASGSGGGAAAPDAPPSLIKLGGLGFLLSLPLLLSYLLMALLALPLLLLLLIMLLPLLLPLLLLQLPPLLILLIYFVRAPVTTSSKPEAPHLPEGAAREPRMLPAPLEEGGTLQPPDASPADWWDALRATEAAARGERASAALAARGPEDGVETSRPVPPALPTDAWAVIMDYTVSCRYADGTGPFSRLFSKATCL